MLLKHVSKKLIWWSFNYQNQCLTALKENQIDALKCLLLHKGNARLTPEIKRNILWLAIEIGNMEI